MQQSKNSENNIKTTFITVFKNCLDVLRNEGITGSKSLRDLSNFLILKLLEPHFGKDIDIDNYDNYNFGDSEDELEYKKDLLEISRFSVLANEKEEDINTNIRHLWKEILSVHPATRNIFSKERNFAIQRGSNYKKIIDKLVKLDLSKNEHDLLGSAYEEVIQDVMVGRELGQYFTPLIIKNIMIKLINPKILPNGKIETCADPTMGTGGFLISYLKNIMQQAKEKNINLDWEFIKNEGIYGKEIEPDTYQMAVSNMLISSGYMFEKLDNGDSVREPILRKFDNILANPPFGIKGLKYEEIKNMTVEINGENKTITREEYAPLKTNRAVPLFIQIIISMLKIKGKCAVVLPNGEDLYSKSKILSDVREYLMKTCNLKKIIYLPSKIFTNTSISTCILYFIKKREGNDVITKKNKKYIFSKTHKTKLVKFYNYDMEKDKSILICEIPIANIAENNYSLNYSEYLEDETSDKVNNSFEIKTLGEIFDISKGSLQSSKNIEGEYTFITAADENKTHNKYTHDCECVMLVGGAEGSLAKAQYFKGKFIASDLLFILTSLTENTISYKYVWYYLNYNREKHVSDKNICCGTPKKMISKERCSNIKILIPSLEKQNEIVKYLDFIEKSNKLSSEKIENLKESNKYYLNNQIKVFNVEKKTLDELCEVNYGTRITKKNNEKGIYPVYGSGKATFTTNNYNREGFNILIGRFALSEECVRFTNEKIFLNDSGLSINTTDDKVIHKYLCYYLIYNKKLIYNLARGPAQKNLDVEEFKSLQISVPSLETQNEIVKYCDNNEEIIKKLENEIEENKKQANLYLKNIMKISEKNLEEKIEPEPDTSSEAASSESSSSSNSQESE